MSLSKVLRACFFISVVLACPIFSRLWIIPVSAQPRKELRVGVAGVPATIDPAAAIDGAVPLIARQIFDTLVAFRDDSTDITPALATRWVISKDGLTWTFTLRDGVRFSDGAPLTATEVVASFARGIKPATTDTPVGWAALLRGSPGVIKEVRAIDPRTVQIVLVQPYAPLLTVLAHPALAIVHVSSPVEGTERVVGTGPYHIVDASPGRMALEATPGHWGGAPRMERLVFLEVGDDAHAEAEMDAHALDIWFPANAPRRAEGALSLPGLRVGYLAFQTEKEPFVRKPLRQAVAAALDPATLATVLEGAAVPLQSFLPPGVWARREGGPVLGGTRAQVRTLLSQATWPKGATATLLVSSETAGLDVPKLAEAIATMLGAADIPARVQPRPAEAVARALQAGTHEMALAESSVTGGDPHMLLFPLSTSEGARPGPAARNFSYYRNPRLDDILIRASQLSSRVERARLYQRAQALLADDMPWIPVYVRLVWGVARPEVRNLRLHATGLHRLANVVLEPRS
jgi:peptide/nickel transport system substrate-binding protein